MKRIFFILSIAVLLLGLTTVAVAQLAGYDLTWWTVDSGGGTSTSIEYTLSGTIGQPDAGNLSSDQYTLSGGFWGAGVSAETNLQSVYLPLVRK